ncbi:hypothetical protein [Cupriavidus sp. UYPR2.512]|uniref:hypothetical protein n=1 Tax=Cupriavidus sp. UYPR2.512 TaxID=1080187 RepID=UPI00037D9AE2|nr:hypothetical protein [Cupriavidus sp. UYPR2.512]UIF90843.1 hypothetical protein KAF44_32155 [Cupriavidus necator]
MNSQYAVYNGAGRILRYGSCPEEMVQIQANHPGESVIVGACDDLRHYVAGGEILERPENTATLIGTILTGLPVPCTIIIDGQRYGHDESAVELDLLAGEHTITVEAFPVLDATFTVSVP